MCFSVYDSCSFDNDFVLAINFYSRHKLVSGLVRLACDVNVFAIFFSLKRYFAFLLKFFSSGTQFFGVLFRITMKWHILVFLTISGEAHIRFYMMLLVSCNIHGRESTYQILNQLIINFIILNTNKLVSKIKIFSE